MPDPSRHATLPAETAWCLTCGFEHTRRPDWLCPRCGMPAGTEPPSRQTAAAYAATGEEPAAFPMGSIVAGAAMAANAAALLALFAMRPASGYRWAVLGAAGVLVVLALELLLKVRAGRWIAAAVAVAVALVASEGALRERVPDLFQDPLPAPIRQILRQVLGALGPAGIGSALGLAAGCLLLVAGRPRRWRIVAGAVLALPLAALALVVALGG